MAGSRIVLDALFKPHMDRLWAPIGQLAARLGLTPNRVTYLSLLLCGVNALSFTLHQRPLVFALGLLLFEALDNVDGALARATHACTPFGSYLDAVTDRYKDAFAVLAVGVVTELWLACGVLLAGSLLVSYTQARAQAQGAHASLGGVLPMFERLERVVTLALGLIAAHFCQASTAAMVTAGVLWGSALMTHATALQRIWGARRALIGPRT